MGGEILKGHVTIPVEGPFVHPLDNEIAPMTNNTSCPLNPTPSTHENIQNKIK